MLFQKNIIKKYLATLPKEVTEESWKKYQDYFLNADIQTNIRLSKEEQFQEGFLRELFVKILGYTLNPSPDYNLITEQKNETNAKKADGAILLDGKVIGVIELKDHKTTDLSKIEAQAFGYKSQHVGTRIVIISNFEKLRLYIDNAVEHREWNLFQLSETDFRELYLCLAWQQVKLGTALQMKQESVSSEDQITKKLYRDYSQFKRALFADIIAQNPVPEGNDEKEWQVLLFKKTQKLLDRFLFIFFAEDCGLLPPNSMVQIISQWEKLIELDEYQPFYNRVKKYFGYMNTGFQGKKYEIFAYNGGLFKPDEVLDNIKITDKLLVEHSKRLSEYDFESDVDVNILGHIFENSLTEIEEITNAITAGHAVTVGQAVTAGHAPLQRRKQDGVFYTPQYITKYIVENTVGRLCVEKKNQLGIIESEYFTDQRRQKQTKLKLLEKLHDYRQWLLQVTILDPACGSGAFLNAALQFLMAEHKQIDEMEAKVTGSAIVFQDVENSILENNLYGVDINEESVEIAKLSLWLRTAKPHRKLNSLNQNIKCGNSLISDPTVAGDKAFNWQEQFPKVFEKGGFDVVIGNPPYGYIFTNKSHFSYIENNYKTAEYKIDAYSVFIERSICLCKPDAYISMITPYTYLSGIYFSQLRTYLSNLCFCNLAIMGKKVFADADVDTGIFVIQKGKNDNSNNKVAIIDYRQNEEVRDFQDEDVYFVNQGDLFFDYSNKIVVCPQKQLNLYKKINQDNKKLQELVYFYHGIQTRGNKESIRETKESDNYYPILRGRDFNRFSPPIEQVYFDLRKENIKSGGDLSFHQTPKKIIIRTTGDSIVASIDYNANLVLNSVNIVTTKNNDFELEFLLCVLSSSLMRYWYNLTVQEVGKTFAEVKIVYLEQIPIPSIDIESQKPFVTLAKTMLSLNEQLQEKRSRFLRRLSENMENIKITTALQTFDELDFAGFVAELKKQKIKLSLAQQDEWEDYFNQYADECRQIATQIATTDQEIDSRVFDLYGLTEEERQIVVA